MESVAQNPIYGSGTQQQYCDVLLRLVTMYEKKNDLTKIDNATNVHEVGYELPMLLLLLLSLLVDLFVMTLCYTHAHTHQKHATMHTNAFKQFCLHTI